MEVKVGMRVQAVDQLGRWEDGKICEVINANGGQCVVKFLGWGDEYKKSVLFSKDMKLPVEPFYRQIRSGKSIKFILFVNTRKMSLFGKPQVAVCQTNDLKIMSN